ncbi:MAG: OmpA family protein [candidate division Zixibacteria bacterium]|nr:OmpA family protein [candidate division Zixibacteria bacterium]
MLRSVINIRLIGLLLILTLVCGGAVADVEETLTYQGNRARIAVGTIKPKADRCTRDMAAAIGEMLSTTLVNTEKFIVLASQEEVGELADEIDLAQSGYVEEGRGPDKGLMEGADLLITGAVTSFEPDAGGSGGGLGGLTKKAFGKVGIDSKTAKIEMDIKLIDIRTRRVLKAKTIKAESKNWKVGMDGGGWTEDVAMVGDLGMYSNEPMEKAIRAALAQTIDMVSKEVPKEYYRYQGQGQYTQEYGGGQTAPAPNAPAAANQMAPTGTATATATATATSSAKVAEDMTIYSKYDFIPGDKVLFYDDMSNEEEGEFPFRWNLERGVLEIIRMGGEFWIMCTNDGRIRPRMKDAPLPEEYTVELEFYSWGDENNYSSFTISWVDAKGSNIAQYANSGYGLNHTMISVKGKTIASKSLPDFTTKGPHKMRIMATSRSIKCYLDEERVANIPRVDDFHPVGFRLETSPDWRAAEKEKYCLFRGFRFAEGGKSFKDQMAETGRVVTHGILFDKGSATIKGQSFKTLKNIGDMLTDDPALRVCIEGHTDSDGADDFNMTLSRQRAESVRQYLTTTYGIAADRLECQGKGESSPIDTNDSPEGKANNRRVEFVKL